MTVKLPHEQLEKTIDNMFPGETLWTVPWAMIVDEERNCYLRADYPVHNSPCGTVQMLVHRNTKGFEVEAPKGFRYHIGEFDATTGAPLDNRLLRPITKLTFASRGAW